MSNTPTQISNPDAIQPSRVTAGWDRMGSENEQKVYMLTDGHTIYDVKLMSQDQYDEAQETASFATDGEITWIDVTNKLIKER